MRRISSALPPSTCSLILLLLLLLCCCFACVNTSRPVEGKITFYFMHIEKTGGTSFHRDGLQIVEYNPNNVSYGIFMSEVAGFNYSYSLPGREVRVMTIFRHPVDFILSRYQHCVRHRFQHQAVMPPFSHWLKMWQLQLEREKIAHKERRLYDCFDIRNAQTRQMQGHAVQELWLLGLTEYYAATICMLHYQLEGHMPKQCSCETGQTISVSHIDHYVQHMNRSLLTSVDLEIIRNLTALDSRLYRAAEEEFLNRVDAAEIASGFPVLC